MYEQKSKYCIVLCIPSNMTQLYVHSHTVCIYADTIDICVLCWYGNENHAHNDIAHTLLFTNTNTLPCADSLNQKKRMRNGSISRAPIVSFYMYWCLLVLCILCYVCIAIFKKTQKEVNMIEGIAQRTEHKTPDH